MQVHHGCLLCLSAFSAPGSRHFPQAGQKVQLVLEGEETTADKNIIEVLADPLIHIVRNSLDHGLETPEVRVASGKPATGWLIKPLAGADLIKVIKKVLPGA